MKSHKEFKPTLEELGQRIYQLRISKNLTTKQMAPMISLTPEAYRNIEKGESDPSITTVLLICKALEIDFSELIKSVSI
jgi:DNA-binding XRE family transcriptional regulator